MRVAYTLAKCNQAMNALCEHASAGMGAMCENTVHSQHRGCSLLILLVVSLQYEVIVVCPLLGGSVDCQDGMLAGITYLHHYLTLVLVQVRASLPSNMETISPTAHIDWVSCRYVRASTRPLQREVARWGNCVSNAEIASTTKTVHEAHDGDKQAEVDLVRDN